MRPDAVESLRAIQFAVSEALLPEVQTPFAEEAAQAAVMLVESLASELDTAVEDLLADNESLRDILTDARAALGGNERAGAVVNEIDAALDSSRSDRMAVSVLSEENSRLRAALTSTMELIEDVQGHAGAGELAAVRSAAYGHLRRLAVRGWTFFDVSAFRERIVQARAELGE